MNKFLEDVAFAISEGKKDEDMPYVEASRPVVEYINRGNIPAFDSAGYCIFNGVKVYEAGKRAEVRKKELLTMEQRVFG